ncbi:sirohydrochlorin chelatase [Cohnella fermenti]|uniref:sirohydrochlorin chelatase n=1 Tax=Cohnella fermenti TaxID=2565925 RepID=UPI001E3DA0C4|nr:CbiX/SirB N-terminal domain-containing protein [Cohnella fermenti]
MKPGILVIGHGSREAHWAASVEEAVGAVREALRPVPVEAAYLELVEGRLIQDGIDRLEAAGVTDILAIPLFVSAGSTHVDEIGWALGAYEEPRRETDLERIRVRARLTYGRPIADDSEIADVLLDRVAEASGLEGREAAEIALLLVGHGSEEPWFYEEWHRGLDGLAALMKERGGYADAGVATLRPDEVAAAVRSLKERAPGLVVAAVPVMISEGYFTSSVIPRRLDGLGCVYAESSLLPHPKLQEWIRRQASLWLREQEISSRDKEGEHIGENQSEADL